MSLHINTTIDIPSGNERSRRFFKLK